MSGRDWRAYNAELRARVPKLAVELLGKPTFREGQEWRCLKTYRTATSLRLKKGGRGRLIGRTKGGMNTKLHAVTDSQGRPIRLFITIGQVSDYVGARALCGSLPAVDWLIADRDYGADWFRDALQDKGIWPCISAVVFLHLFCLLSSRNGNLRIDT